MSSRIQSPTSALIAHVEHIVSGSRVLVIGSAQNFVPAQLLARGARLVQVLDPDAKRVALSAAHNSERRVTYAQLTETSLRDASFDCAIVEDLSMAHDPQRLLAGVRRSIGSRGLAMICAASSDKTSGLLGVSTSSISYGDLQDFAEQAFDEVMMLGQAPFVGYAVVSLTLDAPPEPCLDNEFLSEPESADRFIALCGSQEVLSTLDLEDMTIVQLPASRVLEDGESLHREREQRAQGRIETLELENRKLRERAGASELEALTKQLEERDSWIRDLEARAETAEGRVDDLEAEQERLESALEDAASLPGEATELAALREELDSARRAAGRSQKETRWAEERVQRVERELEVVLAEIDATPDPTTAAEVTALEQALADEQASNRRLTREAEEARRSEQRLQKELSETETELEETHALLIELRARLDRELQRSRTESDSARQTDELAAVKQAQKTASQEATRLRQEVQTLQQKLSHSEQQAKTEREHSRTEQSNARLEGGASPQGESEVRQLERQLVERARRITELEEQLRKLELFSKTLTAELNQTHSKTQVDKLESELDRIAQSLAEREADLVAAEWTIGELKQKLTARAS